MIKGIKAKANNWRGIMNIKPKSIFSAIAMIAFSSACARGGITPNSDPYPTPVQVSPTSTDTPTSMYTQTAMNTVTTTTMVPTYTIQGAGFELKDWREPSEVITPENMDRVEKIGEIEFTDTVFNFSWSPDGTKFAVSLLDNKLYILEANNLNQIYILQGGFPAFSYDGRILEVGGVQYDLTTGERIPREDVTIRSSGGNFSDVEFSPNGEYVIGAGREYIYIYPMKAGMDASIITRDGAEPVHASISPDSKFIAVNYRYEDFTELWDINELRPIRFLKLKGISGFNKPRFSLDGKSVFFLGYGDWKGEGTKFLQEWDYHTGKPLDVQIIPGVGKIGIMDMDISMVSDVVAMGINDGRIILLPIHDCRTGEVEMVNNLTPMNKIAFRPDGKIISTLRHIDNKIELWGILAGRETPTVEPSTETTTTNPTSCPKIPMDIEQPIPKHGWLAQ
jgi:WD40 repeat protein